MPIPPELLAALSGPTGVVFVIGAGCSVEPPTNLRGGGYYAEEAFRQLTANGTLDVGDCDQPGDMCCVTDAVVEKTGAQEAMVNCLPTREFRNAEPNIGYLIAAALMREGALSSVVTLNFDLALSKALSEAGATDDISIISGPGQHSEMGNSNLVYLHRNVDCDAKDLILTTDALEAGWVNGWEQAVANMMLASPTVVFAGLGSRAKLLTETISRIGTQLKASHQTFLVGTGNPDQSDFFADLEIGESNYIKARWCDFMVQAGQRIVADQITELQQSCTELCDTNDYPPEDLTTIASQLSDLGIIALGKIRARWLLHERNYATHKEVDSSLVADILLGIAMIERLGPYQSKISSKGTVSFWTGQKLIGTVGFVSGKGSLKWFAVEARIQNEKRYFGSGSGDLPKQYVLSGIEGGRPADIGFPEDIVSDREPDSIVTGDEDVSLYLLAEIRQNNDLLDSVLAH